MAANRRFDKEISKQNQTSSMGSTLEPSARLKRLLDECNEISVQQQRAQAQNLFGPQSYGGRTGTAEVQSRARTIDQLYNELTNEKSNQHNRKQDFGPGHQPDSQETEQSFFQRSQNGRDFLARKRFDVGEFEDDLRNIHSMFDKMKANMQKSAKEQYAAPSDTLFQEQVIKQQDHRCRMRNEGINANQRVAFENKEGDFYSRKTDKFKAALKNFSFDEISNEITIPALNHTKIQRQQPANLFGQQNEINQIMEQEDLDEKQLSDLLQKKPLTSKIDHKYLETMSQRIQDDLFREWPTKESMTLSKSNVSKLQKYQPHLRKMVFGERCLKQDSPKYVESKLQGVLSFAKSVLEELSRDLEHAEKEAQNSMDEAVQEALVEKRSLVQVWVGLYNLVKSHLTESVKNQNSPKEYQFIAYMNLFAAKDSKTSKSDTILARTLCSALEQQFKNDLLMVGAKPSNSIIIEAVENWVNVTVARDGSPQLKQGVEYCEKRQSYPYCVIFVLFLIHEHEAGLEYAKACCPKAFYSMYDLYVNKYGCNGFDRSKAKEMYDEILRPKNIEQQINQMPALSDQYKILLANLMIGSVYKEDQQFKMSFLFGDPQIARWLSLKVASFEFASDSNLSHDYLPEQLPSSYKSVSLRQLQIAVSRSQLRKDAPNDMDYIFGLFYTGQFTKFLQEFIRHDKKYFVDAVHIGMILVNLHLLKTKFQFYQLLQSDAKKTILQKHDYNESQPLYNSKFLKEYKYNCLDFDGVLAQFMMKMVNRGDCNDLSDATCILYSIEDEQVGVAAMAQYVINNKRQGPEQLESQSTNRSSKSAGFEQQCMMNIVAENVSQGKDLLNFDPRNSEAKIFFRKFIGDRLYSELLLKIVEFNQSPLSHIDQYQLDNFSMNVMLLDKIQDHQKVIDYMVRFQEQSLTHFKPKHFLKPTLDLKMLQEVNRQNPNGVELIPMVSKLMQRTIDKYKKLSLDVKHKPQFDQIKLLEQISQAFNYIKQGELMRAQKQIDDLNIFPKDKASVDKCATKFDAQKWDFKMVVLDVACASAKCIYCDALNVIRQLSHQNTQQIGQTLKNNDILKQRRAQMTHLGEFVDSIIQNKMYSDEKDPTRMETLVNDIAALIRKMSIEII